LKIRRDVCVLYGTAHILDCQALPKFYLGHRLTRARFLIRIYDDAGNVIATHEHKIKTGSDL